MNRRVVVWLLLSLSLALAACGSPARDVQTAVPRSTADGVLTIAWLPKLLSNPVFERGRQGALQRAAELSAAGPVRVEVLYVAPVAADAAEQARIVDDVIARGVDAIAISCNDPTACIDPINKAVAAGIPVMTWDSDAPDSQRFTYLGIDNYQAGQTAAEMLVREMGPRGKVAILTGTPGGLNLEQRVAGFKERLRAYPDIRIVATIASNEDINLGVQGVEETMQMHPDLGGWFFAGMWPLFADRGSMPLWEDASLNRGLKTIAFDTLPLELTLLRDGYLSGLIGQKYWGWGYDSVQILYDQVMKRKTYPPTIDTGVDIVTSRNVGAMISAWDTNTFDQPLPPPYPTP